MCMYILVSAAVLSLTAHDQFCTTDLLIETTTHTTYTVYTLMEGRPQHHGQNINNEELMQYCWEGANICDRQLHK